MQKCGRCNKSRRIKNALLALLLPLTLASASSNASSATCDLMSELDCQADSEAGKWTFGVGVAGATGIPDYIGSDEDRQLLLPVPYITYKGPRVTVNQSGITGKLFNADNWYLSLSLSGAIPVNSDDNRARAGMADLEAVFEYGPSLKYFFQGHPDSADAVFVDLNLREARTLSLDSLDFNASPALVWRNSLEQTWLGGRVTLNSQIRWEYVSDQYANYFYGVTQADVTAQRSFYQADGGFAGYRINQSLRWQKDNQVFSFFVGYANIAGATFAPSPLVKKRSHVFAGGAWFWLFDW